MKKILISNDDGIYGLGLRPLIRALRPLGKLLVVVPDGERSAASHSITLHKPFRVQTLPVELTKKDVIHVYITNGTPSDCVRFGVLKVLKNQKPDLIVGGINHGPNMGEDTVYSGTVAIAREGSMMGIPSFAVSVLDGSKENFDAAAKVSLRIAKAVLRHNLPQNVFLNVNVPPLTKQKAEIEVTRLGKRVYGKVIPSGIDPRGNLYYWLAGDMPKAIVSPGTDMSAVKAKKVSITPLSVDSTYNSFLPELNRWELNKR